MGKPPKISDAEWEVIKIVWDKHPVTANDVVQSLTAKRNWSDRTVRTMLNRLVRKGALGFTVDGNRYLYYPKADREKVLKHETESFLERVFDGALTPMLVEFVSSAKLSRKDIEELRKVIESRHKE